MNSTEFHGTNHGIQVGTNHGSIIHQSHTPEDIDQLCIRSLCCPDSLVVKNRLKETKDKLLRQSFEWVLQDPNYLSWRNGSDVCLLWIKGGAGQGKTMMSIGLIEELSQEEDQAHSTVITYFFCQNADNELNTLDSLIKGLILRLINQRVELKESLRRRWDSRNDRFRDGSITSWRALWNILLEMLDQCSARSSKIYIVVDALDECEDSGMTDFLKLIVRHGLDRPTKIKWLLTSRPLQAAETALLASHDQVKVSLDLNSHHVAQSVQNYISFKVNELSQQNTPKYGDALTRQVKDHLSGKTEGTFLWVSLVCKRLEGVHPDNVLDTIQDFPPGLHRFYDRVLHQLNTGAPGNSRQNMRLLQVMMLAYRPLRLEELPALIGLTSKDNISAVKELVDCCASFVKMGGSNIEFVHQSARDYLASDDGLSILESYESFRHYDIVLSCLVHLSEHLRVNLLDLPRPDSTPGSWPPQKYKEMTDRLSFLSYAATYWIQHLQDSTEGTLIEEGPVRRFLGTKLLEWLECLSLLDKIPGALRSLHELVEISKGNSSISELAQDALRFLKRHYHTVAHWPLQTYSSALLFSPKSSLVRTENLHKVPKWIQQLSPSDSTWAPLLQTLEGHSESVTIVIFSPDGTQIASTSGDETVKLWDTATGNLQITLEDRTSEVESMSFSPDGKMIALGCWNSDIELFDTATGALLKTLQYSHPGPITSVAFSSDGTEIISASEDGPINSWDITTGNLHTTLRLCLDDIESFVLSPDGRKIISASRDWGALIKLWDTTTGTLHKTLDHTAQVTCMAFSFNGTQIISASFDATVRIWDTATGHLRKTLERVLYSSLGKCLALSPDGTQFASSNYQNSDIYLRGTSTDQLQMTLKGHWSPVLSLAFSPNGTYIASGSQDHTVKLWSTVTKIDDPQDGIMMQNHPSRVRKVVFSPDGTYMASCLGDERGTLDLWNFTTGSLQRTLQCYWNDSDSPHMRNTLCVAFSPDGTKIAAGCSSFRDDTSIVSLCDASTGDLKMTLRSRGAFRSGSNIAFSPDGHQIAFLLLEQTIEVWDITTGDLQRTLKGHSDRDGVVAFSPKGTHIAVSSPRNRMINIWNIAKPSKATKFLGKGLGRRFMLGPQKQITTPERINSLEFSADGRCLITDIGVFELDHTATKQHMHGSRSEYLQILGVKNQWICYGPIPILRLQTDVRVVSYAMRGDRLAIVAENGKIWRFIIDRRALHSTLGFSSEQVSLPASG